MTGHVLLTAALLLLVVVLGAGARVLILAATRHGRHEQREQAGDAQADSFVAELRGLPAPGRDIYTDHNVWLPRTPTAAELDDLKERFLAAQHKPVRVLPTAPVVVTPTPDVDADVEEWQHILAPAERLATDTDVRAVTFNDDAEPEPEPEDWAESTFVGALLALPIDRVHEAFEGLRHA